MLLVPCPHCGPRNASEFRCRGEVRRRPQGQEIAPIAWRRYLYVRQNPAGWTTEMWFHQAGCRRFLVVERHTVTNEIRVVSPPTAEGRP